MVFQSLYIRIRFDVEYLQGGGSEVEMLSKRDDESRWGSLEEWGI